MGPFVVVDCSGIAETLFESELFGYEKGAFTGANQRKPGLVETAQGGTLFLDEIGDVPLPMQVKLLRLIESGTFRRVGGVEALRADFRLVAATHKPLREMIDDGRFRQDLFTGSTRFRFRCRRCASGAGTSRCWPNRSCGGSRTRAPARATRGPAVRADRARARVSRCVCVAGQHPRAAQRARTRVPVRGRRDDPHRASAGRAGCRIGGAAGPRCRCARRVGCRARADRAHVRRHAQGARRAGRDERADVVPADEGAGAGARER